MLETFEVNKVLIIAPLRVARDTWPAEIEKWDHLKGLDISIIVGDVKTRIAAVHHPAMIYIVNRENIKWLVEYYEKNGMRWDFGMVVIDELSSFKNYQSQRFKFLRKVRPFVKRWVGLTGTPSSNGLMDLWAEIGILDGGERLGKFIGRYREAYFKAGSMNPATGIVFQYVPRQGAEEMIYQRISDITISMKALDYLNMPDCVPTRCEVEMNTQERELYDMLRQDLLIPLKDGDIDAANAASLTGKLLQMSNGAVYDENGKARVIHDHKLEALEDLIEAANGQPVLVAYWFTMFTAVNQQTSEIAAQVGQTPQGWNSSIFSMIRNISDSVVIPIAGIIITLILCYELISMLTERNNLHDVDTWMFFKYFVKMWIAVYLVSHTFDIAMAVFDIGQSVVNSSSGIIRGNTAIDISSLSMQMQAAMATMAIGELVTLALETLVVSWCLKILSVVITVIMYGRMIEIYLYTSLAPIPFATMSNREWGHVGTNYFRGLFALAFQAFLMMVCVAIYAALIGSIRVSSDIHSALFGTMAYTVILCFSLLKTGSLSKQIFGSH